MKCLEIDETFVYIEVRVSAQTAWIYEYQLEKMVRFQHIYAGEC